MPGNRRGIKKAPAQEAGTGEKSTSLLGDAIFLDRKKSVSLLRLSGEAWFAKNFAKIAPKNRPILFIPRHIEKFTLNRTLGKGGLSYFFTAKKSLPDLMKYAAN